MVKNKDTIRSTESIEDLLSAKEQLEQEIRKKKKTEAELALQESVRKMDSAEESEADIIQACYKYIATHRKR